ncbi:hypothetical protein LCGC14_3008420 [marine sediment metagenome]|uniref:Uncharacterized protein n=1 Tax=marine sediment metagenome TaxID=412755 RepID=A0A0F8Z6K3_9ZZZZ
MVLIVAQSWYPLSQAGKAGKAYLEALKKYPEDLSLGKPILRSAVKISKEGIHTIAISSVKEGKFKEAMDYVIKVSLMNAESIEGLKTTIDTYYDLVEAMPFVGLKAPE